jgi:ferredoxin
MTIKTGRGNDYTTHIIDTSKCTRCGLCAKVCKSDVLKIEHGTITLSHGQTTGCVGCARCAAVCPQGCITIKGRTLSPTSLVPLPKTAKASFDSLYSLALTRQNTPNYQKKEVPAELIEKIIAFTATAPAQVPPSNVELLVLAGRDKVHEFSDDIVTAMRKSRWMFRPLFRQLLRPFLSPNEYDAIATHLLPLITDLSEKQAKGDNALTGSAPLAIYFYSVGFADPVDCQIAATYATLAGEALDLATCMLGSVAPFIRYSRSIRKKYGIPDKHLPGTLVVFGYPSVAYKQAIKRQLGAVRYP